jgi:hypothetical protein
MRVTFVTSDEFDSLAAEVAQLKTEIESLRLQAVPSATPEPTDEELPSNVLPFAEHETEAIAKVVPTAEEAALEAARKADEEHLRMNTKELPKE